MLLSTANISPCGRFRYALRRSWAERPLGLVLMHNPSTADASANDPTICRLMGWFERWGYGGFIAVNLVPRRSPAPCVALDWYRGSPPDCQAMLDNAQAIHQAAPDCQLVLVAYGILAHAVQWQAETTLDLIRTRTAAPFKCLGLTKDGFPIHPMARGKCRVPDDAQLVDFPFTRRRAA